MRPVSSDELAKPGAHIAMRIYVDIPRLKADIAKLSEEITKTKRRKKELQIDRVQPWKHEMEIRHKKQAVSMRLALLTYLRRGDNVWGSSWAINKMLAEYGVDVVTKLGSLAECPDAPSS